MPDPGPATLYCAERVNKAQLLWRPIWEKHGSDSSADALNRESLPPALPPRNGQRLARQRRAAAKADDAMTWTPPDDFFEDYTDGWLRIPSMTDFAASGRRRIEPVRNPLLLRNA